ncbi:MAG: hypothetical protein KAT93_02345 [Desulfuromonadales bacterium]|nr:hypothetical protein [Desulfuromonadales bacterium]
MLCEKFSDCPFFEKYKDQLEGDTYHLFVDSYCRGKLQECCKRKVYEQNHGKPAPNNLCPSGYSIKNT